MGSFKVDVALDLTLPKGQGKEHCDGQTCLCSQEGFPLDTEKPVKETL